MPPGTATGPPGGSPQPDGAGDEGPGPHPPPTVPAPLPPRAAMEPQVSEQYLALIRQQAEQLHQQQLFMQELVQSQREQLPEQVRQKSVIPTVDQSG
eukprot:gene48047-34698_t